MNGENFQLMNSENLPVLNHENLPVMNVKNLPVMNRENIHVMNHEDVSVITCENRPVMNRENHGYGSRSRISNGLSLFATRVFCAERFSRPIVIRLLLVRCSQWYCVYHVSSRFVSSFFSLKSFYARLRLDVSALYVSIVWSHVRGNFCCVKQFSRPII